AAFGYGKFNETGNLMVTDTEIRSQKTIGLLHKLFGDGDEDVSATGTEDGISNSFVGIGGTPERNLRSMAVKDDPLTKADETSKGNTGISIESEASTGTEDADTAFNNARTALINAITRLEALAGATAGTALTVADDGVDIAADSFDQEDIDNAKLQYKMLKDSATANARGQKAGNVKIERDAWMVSGKIKFGGPIDFRFSYMDADDLEVSCGACSGDWEETAADAWNVGMFYTMPGGTELRLTYSEVNNDDNGTYGQGISGTGLGTPGAEIEMFAVGIVHWFD
ncbi:MAG: porin, partial [Gammaproteobacteria bacterium]|nr:porin [Gammaproteobacteria bacterium]